MTFAEIIFLIAGVIGIYVLLRPLQRCLESYFRRKVFGRYPRARPRTIDVTDFTSRSSHTKEDHHHEHHS
jgi:hypothetical protein